MRWVGFIFGVLVANAVLVVSFAYAALWVPFALVAIPIAVGVVAGLTLPAPPRVAAHPPDLGSAEAPADRASRVGGQQQDTPYRVGERVVVDLTQLASLPHRGDKREAMGTVLQVLGPGMYDIFFFPDRPYPELSVASFVPEQALRRVV